MSAVTGLYSPAGQGWRLAYSLVTLAHELAAVFGDQLTCLGTVGDVAHAAEAMGSDHNPFIRDPNVPSIGIVRAIDLGGADALLKSIRQHIWALYAAQDSRVYEYGYSKGCSDNQINNWGLPFGTHVDTGDAGHLHISVTQVNGNKPSPSGYVAAIDSTASWGFASLDPSGGGTPIGGDVTDPNDTQFLSLLGNIVGNTFAVEQKLDTANGALATTNQLLAQLIVAVQAIPTGPQGPTGPAGASAASGPMTINFQGTGTATPEVTA